MDCVLTTFGCPEYSSTKAHIWVTKYTLLQSGQVHDHLCSGMPGNIYSFNLDTNLNISTFVLWRQNDVINAMLILICIYLYNSKPPHFLLSFSFISNCSLEYTARQQEQWKAEIRSQGLEQRWWWRNWIIAQGSRWVH